MLPPLLIAPGPNAGFAGFTNPALQRPMGPGASLAPNGASSTASYSQAFANMAASSSASTPPFSLPGLSPPFPVALPAPRPPAEWKAIFPVDGSRPMIAVFGSERLPPMTVWPMDNGLSVEIIVYGLSVLNTSSTPAGQTMVAFEVPSLSISSFTSFSFSLSFSFCFHTSSGFPSSPRDVALPPPSLP